MNRMGFGRDKIIPRRRYGNKPVTAIVGGKTCHFQCIFEHRWAQRLEILKETGVIKEWAYEDTKFEFTEANCGEVFTNGPMQYTPDFHVWDYKGVDWFEETKGRLEGSDTTKFRRLEKHKDCPTTDAGKIRLILVMYRMPKPTSSDANRIRISLKYINEVIDGSACLKTYGRLIL